MEKIELRLNTTIGPVALILVPLCFSLSELFHPITLETALLEIQSAGRHSTRWLVAHLFALIALLLVPFIALKLCEYIDKKYGAPAISAVSLAILGAFLTMGLLAFDFLTLDMSGISARQPMVDLYERLSRSIFGLLFMKIGPLAFLLGLAGLVVFMLASNVVGKWKSSLILIGIVIYGLAGPLVPMKNAHILVNSGALIMLAGCVSVLLTPRKV